MRAVRHRGVNNAQHPGHLSADGASVDASEDSLLQLRHDLVVDRVLLG
jgi:hypothetical protein